MDGGKPGALDMGALGFSSLTKQRLQVMKRLQGLSDSEAIKSLKLGPRQLHELERNRSLHSGPLLPALDRYTGVLYDGIDAGTLSANGREFAHHHVVVHSALFGLVRAGDPIPAYRLSGTSSLGSPSLKSVWFDAITTELAGHQGLVIDLRSKAYAALGPAPISAVTVSVVTRDGDGTVRALNHFNKKAKGEFTRSLVEAGEQFSTVSELVAWALDSGISLRQLSESVVELEVG